MLNYKIKVGFFLIFFVLYAALAKSAVYADWSVDGNGNLVYTAPNGKVLGIVYAKDGDSGGGGGGGDDHGGGGGSSSSGGGGSGNPGGGGSDHGGGGGGGGGDTHGGGGGGVSGNTNVGDNTLVDCVGPDGKHTQTSFKSCSDFNKSWNNNNFSFQVVPKPPSLIQTQSVKPTEVENENKTPEVEIKETKETENETASGGGRISSGNKENDKDKTGSASAEIGKEIVSGNIKVKFEQHDGKLLLKAEKADGSEIELGEQDTFKVEESLDEKTVKIATGSGNSFIFAKGTTAAQTQFPLSVDLKTNALTVQTPTGPKVVAILPDTAIQNILAANIINRLSTQNTASTGASTALKSVTNTVVLGLRNGIPVYEINGISDQKILGFIPVSIEEKIVVSAQTGALVARDETPLNSFLDLISF